MTLRTFYKEDGTKIKFNTDVPEIGSIYRSNGALPYKPSYSRIEDTTKLYCDDIEHVIEIRDNSVFFNGSLLVSAPLTHNNGKKFTSAQRAGADYYPYEGEIYTFVCENCGCLTEIKESEL